MIDFAPLIRQAIECGATDHQVEEILAWLFQHERDEVAAREFDETPTPVTAIRPWPCDHVPGILAAHCGKEVLEIFLPTPRPVPHDPFFQPPEPLRRSDDWPWFAPMNAQPAMRRDWQWRDALMMDAPDIMPAGACQGFDHEYRVYGAVQMTCERGGR